MKSVPSYSDLNKKYQPNRSSGLTSPDVKSKDTLISVLDDSAVKKSPPLRLDGVKKKAVISGLLESPEKISFALLFELVPVWLFSLEPGFVKNIHFPQFKSEADLISSVPESYTSWLLQVLQQLDQDRIHYSDNYKLKFSHPILTLVSGSFQFFQDCRSNDQMCSPLFLFIVHHHFRCRHLPHPSFSRVKHVGHGGPTSFETIWSSSVPSFQISPSPIRRNILFLSTMVFDLRLGLMNFQQT